MTRRATTPRVPEKVVQAHIVQLLRSIGGDVWVLGTKRRRGDFHGTMQTPGIGDVFAILPAPPRTTGPRVPVWVECKAAGGRLRPDQAVFRDRCREAELAHIVGGLDELIVFLAERGWVNKHSLPHYRQPAIEGERP